MGLGALRPYAVQVLVGLTLQVVKRLWAGHSWRGCCSTHDNGFFAAFLVLNMKVKIHPVPVIWEPYNHGVVEGYHAESNEILLAQPDTTFQRKRA